MYERLVVLNLIINGLPSKQPVHLVPVIPTIVLNLIINGLPSKRIHSDIFITEGLIVLNLIINGLPSKRFLQLSLSLLQKGVLNLIINGLPSKHSQNLEDTSPHIISSFKPYYKWITF